MTLPFPPPVERGLIFLDRLYYSQSAMASKKLFEFSKQLQGSPHYLWAMDPETGETMCYASEGVSEFAEDIHLIEGFAGSVLAHKTKAALLERQPELLKAYEIPPEVLAKAVQAAFQVPCI